ncbi:MAG: isocitrate/isopropylmalate dehydrogenase family protein [Alphaproteobacteria bacterium]
MDIVVFPGDDIGPEITAAARQVLDAVNSAHSLGLRFEQIAIGMAAFQSGGTTVPDHAMQAASGADGVILGPCGMTDYPPAEEGGINVPGTIRKRLDLYANIRPARTRPGLPGGRPGLDVTIVRENTEGFYADRNMFMGSGEFMPTEDVALSVRKITAKASRRVAETAFRVAAGRRGSVTGVGKQHVLKMSDGLFFREVEAVAAQNPKIAYREMDIDAMAADLYSRPDRFDVILLTNMFGDILSNAAVAMSGSLGLAAALNAGDGHAVANAGHGSAPDIAGRGIANPSGLILSTAMLLDWLGDRHGKPAMRDAAKAIQTGIDAALADPEARTGDVGGTGNTQRFADAVVKAIKKG